MEMNFPQSKNLPIKYLATIFSNTTNSYKFYWFLSILEHINQERRDVIPLNKLISKMIATVWYPVNYYKISFGKQDRLSMIALKVRFESGLGVDAKQDDVFSDVLNIMAKPSDSDILKNLNSLIRYVPYRFLRPWFSKELKGVPDYQINKKIVQLAEKGFKKERDLCLYRFVEREEKCIEIPINWYEYLEKHNKILMDFCLWNLLSYLQKKNPNVPNISEKLFEPRTRDLSTARKFWDLVLDEYGVFSCIYSRTSISKHEYSIDHFIPWRFVTHDLLWNLIPVQKSVNSFKRDLLPSLKKYFDSFAEAQYKAFGIVFRKNRMKMLEDYANLYHCGLKRIHEMPEIEFRNRLFSTVAPLAQIAENMGFESDWTLS